MQGRRRTWCSVLAAVVVTFAFAADSPADKGGQGKGKGSPHSGAGPGKASKGGGPGKANKGGGGGPGRSGDAPGNSAAKGAKKFADDDRSVIRSYYRDVYDTSGNCPPGLARKNNGCLPPGQAKRRWQVGEPLPTYVDVVPLPHDLRVRLAPPLPGYDYGYVDGEILLFATDGRVVVDFVAVF